MAIVQIYNSIVASGIKEVRVIYESAPYGPTAFVAAHIAKRLEEKPLALDDIAWRLCGTSMSWATGLLTLRIGVGCYSQYRYTNLDHELRAAVPDSTEWFNAIVVGALLITADEKIVLTTRPADAHLSAGRLDMPCGHPSGLKALPSNESLLEALRIVIEKELGCSSGKAFCAPLVQVHEEPKLSDDLIFVVRLVELDSGALRRQVGDKKVLTFIDNEPDAIAAFLKSDTKVARPVHLSLACYGRKKFGEKWFLQFCSDKN